MEEVNKDAVIVQEAASAVWIREASNRNARVVQGLILEDFVIIIYNDVINLLLLRSLILIEDSQPPDAVIHVNSTILVTV